MAKKIKLSVPVEVVVRDRDVKLLGVIDRMSKKPGAPVEISLTHLARELGVSADTLRRAVASCTEEGYLVVEENYLPNGAQLENSYALTPEGVAMAKAAREAGIAA